MRPGFRLLERPEWIAWRSASGVGMSTRYERSNCACLNWFFEQGSNKLSSSLALPYIGIGGRARWSSWQQDMSLPTCQRSIYIKKSIRNDWRQRRRTRRCRRVTVGHPFLGTCRNDQPVIAPRSWTSRFCSIHGNTCRVGSVFCFRQRTWINDRTCGIISKPLHARSSCCSVLYW